MATGVSALTTGILYGLGATSEAAYYRSETPSEAATLRSRTNALAIGSTVAGVATLGVGVGLVLEW